jgi:hypothetical protein
VTGLAFDAATSTLYATRHDGALVVVDTSTGAHAPIGLHGQPWIDGACHDATRGIVLGAGPSGLATLDPGTGLVYATEADGRLWRLDLDAGTAVVVAADSMPVAGLAHHPALGP